MRRYGWSSLLVTVAIAATMSTIPSKAADAPVTFTKDVLPILQKNCQSCHRPGQIAPMSLLTYDEARPWARSIKTKVDSRQMPPWFADPKSGHFANDRSLAQQDIDTLVKWADAGAPRGNDADAPAAVQWPTDGWQVKPDLIVRGPEFRVPARPEKNVIEWTTMIIPSGFTKDTWVTSMEITPSDFSASGSNSLRSSASEAGTKSTHLNQWTVFCWAKAGLRPLARMPAMPVDATAAALPASLITLRRLV